ncbi:NADH dehydrogenase [ubiquinone] 1 alpha subcomplex subunit 11-like [Haliotis rubra]|uniref:NADH dehydrogenase [ubiquinone] 1 alpha subcomplex subunit 11-like n=1 Tax=Haliotis rubra TaxID=36100 RepID=UPI001EE57FC6|nr:NADH dehydrogenase [ubiquinone] 1 alpha subcomplex subunit 11-like [Haliotis rubra]
MASSEPDDQRRKRFYNIFSVPDGKECEKKVFWGTTYGAISGSIIASYDIMGYSGASTLANGLGRWAFHLFPMAAVGGTYTAVSCITGKVRGKDGPLNHILGGLAAGSIYGVKFQSQKVGWGVGILIAVVGLTAKTVYMYDFSIFPRKERRQKGFYDYRKSYFTERPNPEGKIDC